MTDTADIYKALEVLVHSDDTHHHEFAAVAERVKCLETQMTALQTPEAVSTKAVATMLEQAVDFAYSTRLSEDDRLAVTILYKRDQQYHFEVSFFDLIIGQWLDAYRIPFAVQGHTVSHTTDFPRSVTWASITEFKEAAMPTLKTGANGYVIETISYGNSTGADVCVYEAEPRGI